MSKVYIITTAYKADRWIKECLDSTCRNKEVTVLLGIDGCEATLERVKEIRGNYKNLRVFYYPENMGTYKTKNDLISKIPDDGIYITFDSDDKLYVSSVKRMLNHMPCKSRHGGVHCISKKLYDKLGGYRGWTVHADSDFIRRLEHVSPVKRLQGLFWRRRHPGQLTKMKHTGLKSALRNKYRKLTNENLKKAKPVIYFKPEKNVGQEI